MSRDKKTRLDQLMVQRRLASDLTRAQALIMSGVVSIAGAKQDKPGVFINIDADISIFEKRKFVSRGGTKLNAALETFGISVKELVCADVGCSTGGFTDVLLQRGAAKVFAIDTAYGELDWKLRSDSRVVVFERANAIELKELPELINLAVIDLSFTPLRKILPTVFNWFADVPMEIVTLFKPQYEAVSGELPNGAVIKDEKLHRSLVLRLASWLDSHEITLCNGMASPIKGSGGNTEFLFHLKSKPSSNVNNQEIVDKLFSS